VEGYFARVHAAMSRGGEVRDLLVIHPIESMWLMKRIGWQGEKKVAAWDQMLEDVVNTLLGEHIDFDYGNEELLSRHAKVTRAKGAPAVRVKKATYRAVLVPPMITMRASTVALLRKFAAVGGTVVFAGDPATCVDAVPSPAVAELADSCIKLGAVGKAMTDALAPSCRRISITDAAGEQLREVIYLLREDAQAFYLFVVNSSFVPRNWSGDALTRDRKASFDDVRIRGFAECAGQPVELDPCSGAMHAADATQTEAGWEIRTSLPRIASRLFVIPKAKAAEVPPRPPRLGDVRSETLAPERWRITLSDNNCLVLDRPRYRIGKGEPEGPMEILRVDSAVRNALGIPRRGGAMVQPWAREKAENPRRIALSLVYEFDIEALPGGAVYLAIERPERFRVAVNGESISTDATTGWWVDKSLRKVPIDPALLRLGKNELALECDFDQDHSGLEIIYLLGNFGTKVNGTDVSVVAAPESLALGDWCEQGLAFYGGSVSYRQKISPSLTPGQRLFVRLGEYRGVAVRVLVDGRPAGVIAWDPSELEITDAVAAAGGEVELALEVIGHRRNSHGPLHLTQKWPTLTGPGDFVDRGERWLEGYQLVPVGLMTAPQLVVRQQQGPSLPKTPSAEEMP